MIDVDEKLVRVILVDDHKVVRAGIRAMLEQYPQISIMAEASNGKEACELTQTLHPDVVVVDIQMPVMNGIEFTRWIRSKQISVGILVLSAFDDSPYIQSVFQAGANGYVLKTAEPDEIATAVFDVFEGKTVLDATLRQRVFNNLPIGQNQVTKNQLTDREIDILKLVAQGFTNKAVAMKFSISERTVQNHLANIFLKLNAESRTEAVMRAVAEGLIHPDIGNQA